MRNRIVESVRVRAAELVPNPRNWRLHPEGQRRALSQMLSTVGNVDRLKCVRLHDGRLQLIDGHLRASLHQDEHVLVDVLDLNEREQALVLATFDPLSALADADVSQLQALLADGVRLDVPTDLLQLLDDICAPASKEKKGPADDAGEIPERWDVLVSCSTEQEQLELMERLLTEGRKCRALIS